MKTLFGSTFSLFNPALHCRRVTWTLISRSLLLVATGIDPPR